MDKHALDSIDDLRIEAAAHRLVIRAILAYLAHTRGQSPERTLVEICAMLEGTGPYAVVADDMDDELRAAAINRARHRMANFTLGIQKLPMARA